MDMGEDQGGTTSSLNRMADMMERLQQQMDRQSAQHQEEMNARRKETKDLCTRIQQLQTQTLAEPQPVAKLLNNKQPPHDARQRPCTRYPDMEMFDGSNTKDFMPFKMNLCTKFTMDGPCFLNDEEWVLYAYGWLKGRASQCVLPWIAAKMDA